jgi:hypothetical protein
MVCLIIRLQFAVPAACAGYGWPLPLYTSVFPWNGGGSRSPCLASSPSGAPLGRVCRCRPTPFSDRALRSALFSHRMGRQPRAGDYARPSYLSWHDADTWASLLIVTSWSCRSFRLSRMISSVDCNPVVTGTCADFCLLGNNEADFLHARFAFPSPGRRGFLCEPIARWYVS